MKHLTSTAQWQVITRSPGVKPSMMDGHSTPGWATLRRVLAILTSSSCCSVPFVIQPNASTQTAQPNERRMQGGALPLGQKKREFFNRFRLQRKLLGILFLAC